MLAERLEAEKYIFIVISYLFDGRGAMRFRAISFINEPME